MTDAAPSVLGDQRPLTARSVIASTLLGTDAPRVRVGRLVRAGAMFGIGEGAMRTALWRMVADGELDAGDGWYGLAGRLLDRKRRVDDSHAALRRRWDGTWELAVVSADRRPASERLALRAAAAALHLGEVREGIWARPDNLDPRRLPDQRAVLDAQCLRFAGATGPDGLAARLFDLDGWASRARELLAAMAAGTSAGPAGDGHGGLGDHGDGAPGDDGAGAETASLARGFMLSVAVVRHLQADPLLPDELLPAGWPGDHLRRAYAEHDRAYKRRFTAWLLADG